MERRTIGSLFGRSCNRKVAGFQVYSVLSMRRVFFEILYLDLPMGPSSLLFMMAQPNERTSI